MRTAVLSAMFLGFSVLAAQEQSYFFYRPLPYGSQAMFNPLSLIANGGLDELQAYGHSNTLSDLPWNGGGTNVWRNITAPLPQIQAYGWKKFAGQELFPTSLRMDQSQYFPNYTLHLIGGGMAYRKISEWYDYHGYPLPAVLGALTTMSYHYVNEIIENGPGCFYSNVDPIADLLVFDPLGIALFSFDGVSRFFSDKLQLNEWSSQPAISLFPFGVRNTGQNFVVKYPLTDTRSVSLFYHFGAFGILGVSLKTNDEDAISFGAGISSKKVYNADPGGAFTPAIITGPIAGIYYDRNNSLLASFTVADSFTDIVRMNIYPGFIQSAYFSPGIILSAGERGRWTFGITANFRPLGLCGYHPPM